MMAAVAPSNANGGEQQAAAAAPEEPPTRATTEAMDPRLFMAACCGDSTRLKDLLRIDDGEQATAGAAATAADGDVPVLADQADVVIQVIDPRLHDAVALPPPSPTPVPTAAALLDEHGVTVEGDSLLHVVAACGDSRKFLCCAKMILHHMANKGGAAAKRLALQSRNNKGDTPLHCAAAAGNAKMIKCLVHLLASNSTNTTHDHDAAAAAMKKAFVRLQNERGETALHHAVRSASIMRTNMGRDVDRLSCIANLMAVDPELAGVVTSDGTSPLYLAISLAEMEIAKHLLLGRAKQEGNLSYYSGPGGKNILHAAVSCGHVPALRMVLEWLKQKQEQPKLADDGVQQEGQASAADDLLKQLTRQRDKENGSTPLHLAASLFGFPSTLWILPRTWRGSGPSAISLLLEDDANASTAYQPDKEGMYPIHVAAGGGSAWTVHALLEKCPECATLRDAKGRTFLHVAVEKGRFGMVRYVRRQKLTSCFCRSIPAPAAAAAGFASILNAQDNNGDTPLHRAVHAGNLPVFTSLFWNPRVRLDVQNEEGKRPIDVSWSTMPLGAYYSWDPRIYIRSILLKVAVPCGESRGDLFHEKLARITIPNFKAGADGDKISENLTASAQVMGIFSALITTVTFASAFTLPGGYRSAGDGGGGVAGTPVLSGSYAFDAFVLADALAFICSFVATSLLLYAGVPSFHLDLRFACVNFAYGLMMNSGRSLVAALGLGLYVVLIPVARTIPIAIAVWMIMLAGVFIKGSEGIDYMFNYPIIPTRRKSLPREVLGDWIVFVLEHFWSYILIFGIPAIRKWARAR